RPRPRHRLKHPDRPQAGSECQRPLARSGTARPHAVRGLFVSRAETGAGARRQRLNLRRDIMYPHRIRLRGPWECEPPALPGQSEKEHAVLPKPRRITMPARLAAHFADFGAGLRLRRRFGFPGRLDDFERVWLTFAAIQGQAEIVLNSTPLGTATG